MFSRFSVVLSVLFVFLSAQAWACSCAYRGDFVDYAKGSEGVIHAKIKRYGKKLSHGETLYSSMVVEVVAVITGGLEHDSITLLGDPGFLCRDYVDSQNFVIGAEFLIALHSTDARQSFGGCGEAWVVLDNDTIRGRSWATKGFRNYSLSLTELITQLQQK